MFLLSGSMTECLLRRGVHLWEVKNAVFTTIVWEHMTECPLMRGVCLWEVKSAVFLLSGSMTECPLRRGVCLWEAKYAVFTSIVWEHD